MLFICRKTTIIVDGGEDEFDGKTLGFNHFSNPQRDEYTEEFRSKIGDVSSITYLLTVFQNLLFKSR